MTNLEYLFISMMPLKHYLYIISPLRSASRLKFENLSTSVWVYHWGHSFESLHIIQYSAYQWTSNEHFNCCIKLKIHKNHHIFHVYCSLVVLNIYIFWCGDHFRVPLFLAGFTVDLLWLEEPGLTGFSPCETVNWDQTLFCMASTYRPQNSS